MQGLGARQPAGGTAHPPIDCGGMLKTALIAFSFLALGVWVGTRLLLRRPPADRFTRNERALGSLGITDREYDVLRLLAAIRDYGRMARRHPFGRCRGRLSCRGIPARHTGEDLPCYAAS